MSYLQRRHPQAPQSCHEATLASSGLPMRCSEKTQLPRPAKVRAQLSTPLPREVQCLVRNCKERKTSNASNRAASGELFWSSMQSHPSFISSKDCAVVAIQERYFCDAVRRQFARSTPFVDADVAEEAKNIPWTSWSSFCREEDTF